ncbi:MAG TPA: hypothetical protein VIK31_11815 [Propionibacteriaceae bacterium]|jgi:hypothetical protein
MSPITTQTYRFLHDEPAAPKPAEAPKPATAPSTAPRRARRPTRKNIIATLRSLVSPSIPTPGPTTDAHGRMPESAIELAARRLTVEAEKLLPIAAIPRTGPASPSIEMQSLWAQTHVLQIEAQVGGTAEDKLAANAAKALADSVHDAWMAATAPPRPAPIAPPAPVPAVDRGLHTAGRPGIGALVHRWDALNGKCLPAFVAEVYGGSPSSGVVVTAENPYLSLVDAGGGPARTNARWIAKPPKYTDPEPSGRYSSWHRANVAECPGMLADHR